MDAYEVTCTVSRNGADTMADYECAGLCLHTVTSGHFFTVWSEFGTYSGNIERPNKLRGEWLWRAFTRSGKLIAETTGPKQALAALARYIDGEFE